MRFQNQRYRLTRTTGRPGVSLAEYTLIGTLVLLVTVGAFIMAGNNLDTILQDLKGDMVAKIDSAKAFEASANTTNTNTTATSTTGATVYTGLDSLMPMSQFVATSGANGSTTLLANAIEITAEQALTTGQLTEGQYRTLIDLANEGHRIAEALRLIEEAFSYAAINGGNPYDAKVYFEGQTTTAVNLANDLGFDGYTRSMPSDPLDPSLDADPFMQAFQDAYMAAKSSGALNDQAIDTQITKLAKQIAFTSTALDLALFDYDDDLINKAELVEGTASKLTDVDSVQICETGSGTDSGTQCSDG